MVLDIYTAMVFDQYSGFERVFDEKRKMKDII